MAFVLNRGQLRGGEESEPFVIPPDISEVRLEARVEADYPHYEAVLQTVENKQVWNERGLEAEPFPGGKRLLLHVPSNLLTPGDYILTIRGVPTNGSPETVTEYAFRVGRR
jgi:hypothetical protein